MESETFSSLTSSLLGNTEKSDLPDSATLSADMNNIRARVLGRREKSEDDTPTEDENREIYNEMQSRHQIDLNKEENAAMLEDPTLIAHMEASRRRLDEQEKRLSELPSRESLRSSYLKSMGKLSTLIRQLDEDYQASISGVELGFIQARALKSLSNGLKSHTFPTTMSKEALSNDNNKKILTTASEKASDIAECYEKTNKHIEQIKQTIFIIRREVEKFGDGFINLLEATENDRRHLREYLQTRKLNTSK